MTQKLRDLERRLLDHEAELSPATPPPRHGLGSPLTLHPSLVEVYRRKVEDLQQALAEDDAGPARGLVEAVVLIPEGGGLRVEARGELAAILRLSGSGNAKAPAVGPELLVEQVSGPDRSDSTIQLFQLCFYIVDFH